MHSGEVVTIMHVDVEGSTRLTTTRGDEVAQRVLAGDEADPSVNEAKPLAGARSTLSAMR